jgi:hypothetical protein
MPKHVEGSTLNVLGSQPAGSIKVPKLRCLESEISLSFLNYKLRFVSFSAKMMDVTCSLDMGENKYLQNSGEESSSKVTTWQMKKIGDTINMDASLTSVLCFKDRNLMSEKTPLAFMCIFVPLRFCLLFSPKVT